MKYAFLIASLVFGVVGCASAMPPAHKAFNLVVTLPPGLPAGSQVNVYSASTNDVAWTNNATIPASGSQAVLPLTGGLSQVYTATITNNGTESDYGPIATNSLPPAPSGAAIH